MSDENFDGNEDESKNSPKALREALEKANKRLAEFEKRDAEQRAEQRKAALTEVLKAKGLKESAVSHYTADDVSEEAVVKWATDLGLLENKPQEPDTNSLAAARAAALTGGDAQSPAFSPASGDGRAIIHDPLKALELLRTPGFTYEDGVRMGIFAANPNVV